MPRFFCTAETWPARNAKEAPRTSQERMKRRSNLTWQRSKCVHEIPVRSIFFFWRGQERESPRERERRKRQRRRDRREKNAFDQTKPRFVCVLCVCFVCAECVQLESVSLSISFSSSSSSSPLLPVSRLFLASPLPALPFTDPLPVCADIPRANFIIIDPPLPCLVQWT